MSSRLFDSELTPILDEDERAHEHQRSEIVKRAVSRFAEDLKAIRPRAAQDAKTPPPPSSTRR